MNHQPQNTAFDLAERLLSYLGGSPGGETNADIKRAIIDAYREMPGLHLWTCYITVGRLFLNASYNTGTIEYDHTGGANERQMTLTGGTWPSWIARAYIRIGLVAYYVDQRISDTIITLSPTINPGADIASGTAYTAIQDSYQLPADFRIGNRGLPEFNWGAMQYMTPEDWLTYQRFTQSTSGQPRFYTFTADDKNRGRLAFRIFPPPDVAQTIDFVYRRNPRDITTWEQTTGKASVTGGESSVTLTNGGTFLDKHVGSVIRLSSGSTTPPTSQEGLEPYVEERTILSLTSSTVAVVDDVIDDTYSNVAYRISDPIDVEAVTMQKALFSAAIKHLCHARNRKELADVTALWRFDLDLAKESDQRDYASDQASLYDRWYQRLARMPIGGPIGD